MSETVRRQMARKRGFSLVEIMIITAIIGVLASIAVPNIFRARNTAAKNSCIANMKKIRDIVQVWAMETGAGDTDTPDMQDLVPDYLMSWPKCFNASYAIPAVNADPVCPNTASYPDHTLGGNGTSSGSSSDEDPTPPIYGDPSPPPYTEGPS